MLRLLRCTCGMSKPGLVMISPKDPMLQHRLCSLASTTPYLLGCIDPADPWRNFWCRIDQVGSFGPVEIEQNQKPFETEVAILMSVEQQ